MGTQQTLEVMAQLARQGSSVASPVAAHLVSVRGGVADFVSNLDRFLRHNFVYREERDEVLRTVDFMLHDFNTLGRMEGDCDDMSIMSGSLLCAAGISARLTAIQSADPFEYDHVFTEARVGSDWVVVDPTVPYGTTYNTYGFMSESVC